MTVDIISTVGLIISIASLVVSVFVATHVVKISSKMNVTGKENNTALGDIKISNRK